jgi:virginiamycin B lyase
VYPGATHRRSPRPQLNDAPQLQEDAVTARQRFFVLVPARRLVAALPLGVGSLAAVSLVAVLLACGGHTSPTGTVTEFDIPTSASAPAGIVSGPDGNLWFTENLGNKIGRLTTAGAITEYPLPWTLEAPGDITVGPDGALWFTTGVWSIGRITTNGTITEYPVPADSSALLEGMAGIASGPDGNLWYTKESASEIGRITTAGVVTEFTVPTTVPDSSIIGPFSGSHGIVSGPDGNLWFTETVRNKIGRITPSGVITEFALPTSDGDPHGIAAGPDGNLWFTESWGNRIGKITADGTITEFALPTDAVAPSGIATGPDGNLWFTASSKASNAFRAIRFGRIGRITTSGTITEFVFPTIDSPTSIAAGPDGNVWFTEFGHSDSTGRFLVGGNKIGRITP